ncbi:hypothetical protein BgiBS90_004735 [Biomphalaria glabrata]|nr:hypothetical protein BgiBS90_004735 [Biomphalaria glabrata]
MKCIHRIDIGDCKVRESTNRHDLPPNSDRPRTGRLMDNSKSTCAEKWWREVMREFTLVPQRPSHGINDGAMEELKNIPKLKDLTRN